jgi:fatty acid amide hydrolase
MTEPTEMSASEIHAAVVDGTLSACDVAEAHIERIRATHERLNAVIFPLFDQAMTVARAADASSTRQGRLFGVPMTIKDQFFVRGTPTSCGLAHRAKTPLSTEGSLVTRLREQGAIFLGKTNVPQLLVSYECRHALYGDAKNPWDAGRAPGGSSGGEAAIIAVGGSAMGLGGDMGGSIRVPAHCCGICGLSPTSRRFPNDDSPLEAGFVGELAGFEAWLPQPGPMARTVDDLKLAMDALLFEPLAASPHTPPVPWSLGPVLPPDGIRVGFYDDDGVLGASPALRRIVREAKEALRSIGLDVRPFDPPEPAGAIGIALELLGADGGAWVKKALAGEAPTDDIRSIVQNASVPNLLRRPMAALLGMLGQQHASRVMVRSGTKDSRAYWRLCAQRTRYRSRFVQAMREQEVDVLICPPYALPAARLGSNRSGACSLAASYAFLFNLLAMPAGVVAAGRVAKDEESDRPRVRDRTEQDALRIERGSAGMPVGVQVAGLPWREDQVLATMKALETHFRSRPDFPRFDYASTWGKRAAG